MSRARRSLAPLLLAPMIAALGCAVGPAPVDAGPTAPGFERLEAIDETPRRARRAALLAALAAAETEDEAALRADALWAFWRTGPDLRATARLEEAARRLRAWDRIGARLILDALVRDYPDWAEGWNLRATVHFLDGRSDAALADIERVLALEPAHFGALAGRGMVELSLGRRERARAAFRAALKIHPFLPERRFLEDAARSAD